MYPSENVANYGWVEQYFPIIERLDIYFTLGVDSVGLLMVVFTAFIIPLSLLTLIDREANEIL